MATDSTEVRQWRLRETFLNSDSATFLTQLRRDPHLDINFVYGEPAFEPLLLTACRRHDTERIGWLRRAGADFNTRDLSGDRTALLWAAEGADRQLLAHLLAESSGAQPAEETSFIGPALELNARDSAGRTALHLLVAAAGRPACREAAEAGLRLLTVREDVDLGARDERGRTPLELALELGLPDTALALAQAGAEVPPAAVRQLGTDAALHPLTPFVSRAPRPRPADQQLWETVHLDGTADAVSAALDRLPTDAAARRRLLDSPFGRYTCLQWAARSGHLEVARRLLRAGASAAAASALNPQPPLLYAAERGDAPLLRLLLEAHRCDAKPVQLTPLRDSGLRGSDETALHKAARHGPAPADADFDGCVALLLAEEVDVNRANGAGRTALHLALAAGFEGGALRLLAAGASLAAADGAGRLAVELVRPETLRAALDACVRPVPPPAASEDDEPAAETEQAHREREQRRRLRAANCQLEVDFSCLAPPLRPQKAPEMPVLMRLRADPQLRALLQHPVLTALLYLKYDRARWFHYCNVLLFLAFTVLLTVYVFGLDGRAALGGWATGGALRAALTAGLALLTARELLQMLITGPLYLLSAENWAELAVLALGYPLLWAPLTLPTARHLSAWVMVAAWLEVAMNVGRTPALAPYKTMMESIALSFGRLIFLYFGLVMAFAIAFYLVFHGVSSFATFGVSMPKVIAMATGEFDYGDLSEAMVVDEASGVRAGHVLSGGLLFICFLFLIFIVLMNLLTSLAVDDTQAISRQAAVMAADNRIVLLGYLENFLLLSYLPSSLKRPGGPLRAAGQGACSGLKERVRRRVLLFHTALSSGRYRFLPNGRERPLACRDVAHACGKRQCGSAASLCARWLTLDGCVGERRQQLSELPAATRQQLLDLVLKPQSLEEQLERLQADVGRLSAQLSDLLQRPAGDRGAGQRAPSGGRASP
ncbi:uncharacterized protein LOC122387905 [Amphibalanus amphitrite]|uniref:uncharacterized protein LOC122387905 n=1 Tax=Amphibalanus amphitrite TaxID=1232801 RepID=UPI001C8FBC80|nr:uncharacterized protein LOC122387905 [Amphibalanus amphitrite]XP_043234488.1 uncharacterized protein LOC122387905 [Amphibalanus amphitrite]